MTTSELVSKVYLVAAGKLPTFVSGSTKWNKIVAIANNKIDVWQNEPNANWNSLYNPAYSLGAVSATATYDLDDEIRKLSDALGDCVRIQHADGVNYTDYQTVPADQLKRYDQGEYCAQIGKTLVFNKAFISTDPQFGGTIYVPVYIYADYLTKDADTIPVDDPQWLVLQVAAEYNRNDITKQNQYGNLINEANSLMQAMKQANDAQIEVVSRPWGVPGATW